MIIILTVMIHGDAIGLCVQAGCQVPKRVRLTSAPVLIIIIIIIIIIKVGTQFKPCMAGIFK